jgi:hypothetical protein
MPSGPLGRLPIGRFVIGYRSSRQKW